MKKTLGFIFTLLMCMMFALPALADEHVPVAATELNAVEMALYGTTQSDSLLDRTAVLEDDIYGTTYSEKPILTRIQNLYDYVCGIESTSSDKVSFMEKLNAVDSRINDKLTVGPAKTRIEDLEQLLYGEMETGNLNGRLDELVETIYKDGKVPVATVMLPKDSLVKIEFTSALSSKTAQVGDPVTFIVADNLYVNDVLVIAKGSLGVGRVKKVVPPRSFGRDARIDMEFSHVYGVDGQEIPVYIGKLAKQEAKTAAGAAGASIGGMIVLGPIGAIGGAFVSGQSLVIPEGSTTFVQVSEAINIKGIVYVAAA